MTSVIALRNYMREFVAERNWDQFHTPANVMLAMMGEVGELCEIFQWRGDINDISTFEEKNIVHLGEEISDVFIYNLRLADLCGFNLAHLLDEEAKDVAGFGNSESVAADNNDVAMFSKVVDMVVSQDGWLHRYCNASSIAFDAYSKPRNVVFSISSTAGSMCSLFLEACEGKNSPGIINWPDSSKEILKSRIMQVSCLLVYLAYVANLNIGNCLRDKLMKNARKYPAHIVKGSSAKYTEYTDVKHDLQNH